VPLSRVDDGTNMPGAAEQLQSTPRGQAALPADLWGVVARATLRAEGDDLRSRDRLRCVNHIWHAALTGDCHQVGVRGWRSKCSTWASCTDTTTKVARTADSTSAEECLFVLALPKRLTAVSMQRHPRH